MWQVVLVLTTVLVACGDTAERSRSGGEARQGGKIVVAVDLEPQTLNAYLVAGSLALNAFLADKVVLGAWRVSPDFGYVPALLSGEPTVTTNPFTVTFSIRPDAVWSDGVPVTARDFEFTWQTVTNPQWGIAVREGYDKITGAETIDSKTIRFTFSEPYGHWRLLFLRGGVLPAHRLEGRNFDEVWSDGFDVASGPFLFREWVRGDHITLVRNPRYFGRPTGVDELEIRFIPDANTMFEQFRSRDVDVFRPSGHHAQLVRDLDGVSWRGAIGSSVTYLGFNARDPLLSDPRIRQAIGFAVDRPALASAVFGREHPGIGTLDSLVYVQPQKEYVPHFDRYSYDQARVAQLLDEAGCRREQGEVRRCRGRELALSLLATPGSGPVRLIFDLLEADLKRSGIRVTPDFAEQSTGSAKLLSGQFQLVLERYELPPEPIWADYTWACGGSFNFRGACDREVSALLQDAARQLDPQAAATVYNRADARLAEDPPALPLVQPPMTLAWHERIHGPALNPAFPSPFWNAEEWFIAR